MTPILEVRGLSKHFGGLRALDDVDLTIRAGELRAVIGPNGAGKTTLFNVITGYLQPTRGSVNFDGVDITGWATHKVAKAGIGRAFQLTSIFGGLTVADNVRLGVFAQRGETRQLTGRADGMHIGEVHQILVDVGLASLSHAIAGNLSHGDQRALELAISLALEPKLLLLDEPTAGMAPEETRQTMDLVRRIAAERDLTVLFCEHDMDVVFTTADRVLVMAQGQPLAEGTPEQVQANADVQRVYLGVENADA